MIENICEIRKFMHANHILKYGIEFQAQITISQDGNSCYQNETECMFGENYKCDSVELNIEWSNAEYISSILGMRLHYSSKHDTFVYENGKLIIHSGHYLVSITTS